MINRRMFLGQAAATALALGLGPGGAVCAAASRKVRMRFGLVTYLWGQRWDLETLITNCEASGLLGVELRTTHAHGVEPSLSKSERQAVKARFADSHLEWVGIGSNENYDSPDPDTLRQSIAATKAFIDLGHDIGGTGVKVKPNSFHDGVPHQKTIEQIGKSLNELGAYGAERGQQIRLEVHGQCAQLPTIKAIMDVADHPNVGVCWNSNPQDLEGEGLRYNFDLVKDRFGDTAHVRELNIGDYPYQDLIALYIGMDWDGWMLLEARTDPAEPVAAMIEQRKVFESMVAAALA
jgi:sugar phosphate isomerase/epimerase